MSEVVNLDKLDACTGAPSQSFAGVDLYPTIMDKATAIAYAIAKIYHPFLDGNKRAAAASVLAMCYVNGYSPKVTQFELVAVILLVAEGQISRDDLSGFIRGKLL
ncbi:Fic family protein [Actinokineospora sp. NBRC 105648]|uniref:type II toxin-antitoxin system death-on-curing family toxin n=1 Tax=Actinokineospora sp. NBRC 105648 TaxID=3032206 RepID=UPI0025528451|nr:Fic family protein [Actinokineospora sp. NBRC 105648]